MYQVELPPIHNQRAERQWEIISSRVDFEGKKVIDFGCGYADILWRVLAAGAELCVGVDRDKDIVARNNSRRMRQHATNRARIQFVNDTIPSFISNDAEDYPLFDYFICFSVLPYLDSPGGFLYAVTGIADRGLLEVQYLDDGPGTVDRTGLDKVLELFWTTREVIGSTPVDYRNVERDIWLLSP